MNLLKKLYDKISSKFTKKPEVAQLAPLIKRVSDPQLPNPCPTFAIHGWNGFGAPAGTIEWQASEIYTSFAIGLGLTNRWLSRPLRNFTGTHNLVVLPRSGNGNSVIYDRLSLRFFQDANGKHSCESGDVVSHGLWHAILDALRPDIWHAQALEIFAFQESFADIGAILTALSHDTVIDYVIREIGGNLKHPKMISRLSEEMGTTHGSLHKAMVSHKYEPPESLPINGEGLTSNPSVFSSIFTSGFYDIICLAYNKFRQTSDASTALRLSRDFAAHTLLNAVRDAATSTKFFSSVARAMILSAGEISAGLISEAFTKKGINCEPTLADRPSTLRMNYQKECKIHQYGNRVAVRFGGIKQKKINNITVDVPNDHYLEYLDDRLLIDAPANADEAVSSATKCIDLLNARDKIGDNKEFKIVENRLTRNHI